MPLKMARYRGMRARGGKRRLADLKWIASKIVTVQLDKVEGSGVVSAVTEGQKKIDLRAIVELDAFRPMGAGVTAPTCNRPLR